MDVRWRRLTDAATAPAKAHPTDAGFDLTAVEDRSIAPGERAVIGTGIAIELPQGWCALTTPRSGRAAREGLSIVNSPGVIDADYRGELKVICINTDQHESVRIAAGERIAQLLVLPVPDVRFIETESLDTTKRGESGFGSSGT